MLKSGLLITGAALFGLTVSACQPAEVKAPAQAPAEAAPPATAAATPPSAPSTPAEAAASVAKMGPIPGTYTETDQPINAPSWSSCYVVMGHLENAIRDGKTQGDVAMLETARAEFRAKMKATLPTDDEIDQMIASTSPFFDELTPEQLKASTALCLASKDTIAADNV